MIALIIILPLVGAIINGFGGPRMHQKHVTMIALGSILGSFVLSFIAFVSLCKLRQIYGDEALLSNNLYEWFSIHIPTMQDHSVRVPIRIHFVFDSLSSVMTMIITGIGFLIHIYSSGYMKDDPSYARFFSYLNLFTAAMLILVLGGSLPLMFVGWEGVGLCSYLLIGFWWKTPAYAKAARKAFITNRIGDFGVIIGMFLLASVAGSFDFDVIDQFTDKYREDFSIGGVHITTIGTLACLFLLLGCTGKSAQIPLFVWLPDAMAGPTPVSALIHAATMVTSGIYLCARLSPVFLQSPEALTVAAIIGASTALMAASIASVQKDMKKILAYSTISQLGFMFAAIGLGALGAAALHVFTHAFFKACLFLCAGSIMHAVHAHGDVDIFRLGGLRKIMPITHWTFLVSAFAIAGVPLFSGFFSKDEILVAASKLSLSNGTQPLDQWLGWFVLGALFLSALMTSFYIFRLYYLSFSGTYRSASNKQLEPSYHSCPKESEQTMTIPLIALAIGASCSGFVAIPHIIPFVGIHVEQLQLWFPFLESSIKDIDIPETMDALNLATGLGLLAMIIGWTFAYVCYRTFRAHKHVLPSKYLYRFLMNKWHIDELYSFAIIRPSKYLSLFISRIDKTFVDGIIVRGTHAFFRGISLLLVRIQNGSFYSYGLVFIIGLLGLLKWGTTPHIDMEVTIKGNVVHLQAQAGYVYRFDMNDDSHYDPPFYTIKLNTSPLIDEEKQKKISNALFSYGLNPSQIRDSMKKPIRFKIASHRWSKLQHVLTTLQTTIPAIDYRKENHASQFKKIETISYRYQTSDAVGLALVAFPIDSKNTKKVTFQLNQKPLELPFNVFRNTANDGKHQAPNYNIICKQDNSGGVVIRPNSSFVQYKGVTQKKEFRVHVGDTFTTHFAHVSLVPVVRASIEAKNVFGKTAKKKIEFVLEQFSAEQYR